MALANYTDLKAAIASWASRADLTTPIVDMIALCEAEFNRTLRVRQMEQRATTPTVAGTAYLALPTGFLELRNIQINTTPTATLEQVAPELIDSNYSSASGQPAVYCLLANQIQLAPVPDGVYSLEIDYYEVVPPLASNATNWLLASHPDAYLFGSLLRAGGYVQDPQMVMGWKQAYSEVLQQMRTEDRRARWSGSTLRIRPA